MYAYTQSDKLSLMGLLRNGFRIEWLNATGRLILSDLIEKGHAVKVDGYANLTSAGNAYLNTKK